MRQKRAELNIPERDCCGEAVGNGSYRWMGMGKGEDVSPIHVTSRLRSKPLSGTGGVKTCNRRITTIDYRMRLFVTPSIPWMPSC